MDDLKSKSMDILRVLALAGNEAALDEMLRRKDKEIEDAVKLARYVVFMEERALLTRRYGKCSDPVQLWL
jgi:hypothetical protein